MWSLPRDMSPSMDSLPVVVGSGLPPKTDPLPFVPALTLPLLARALMTMDLSQKGLPSPRSGVENGEDPAASGYPAGGEKSRPKPLPME